mmetsp:Transcript_20619/g.30285  ORF Transcript_20619/g.30285 Transcript_20619/m.30285 type:complete len:86 (+) Transcript_20619:985-1242(+)
MRRAVLLAFPPFFCVALQWNVPCANKLSRASLGTQQPSQQQRDDERVPRCVCGWVYAASGFFFLYEEAKALRRSTIEFERTTFRL